MISVCSRQSYDDTVNDKGIQCVIGNEIYRCQDSAGDYYKSFNYLSDEDSSSENDTDVKFKNNESMIDISTNTCFIVFWESLLILFKSCKICSGQIIKLITLCPRCIFIGQYDL